jgi:hypothetical protein
LQFSELAARWMCWDRAPFPLLGHAFYNAPECLPFFQERESILSGPSQQFSVSGDTDFSQSRSENIGEYE